MSLGDDPPPISGPGDPLRASGAGDDPPPAGRGSGAPDPAVPARTRFAWRRMVLNMTVTVLLALRLAARDGFTAPRLAAGAVAMLIWLGVLTLAHLRIQQMAEPHPAAVGRATSLIALAVIGYAVLGIALLP